MSTQLEQISEHKVFGGTLTYWKHQASTTHCAMRFTIFLPPQAQAGKCPALTYLSGLTCTEDNFTVKAGAYRTATELGLIIITPDTSPRGEGVATSPDGGYDLGLGAGFYINATQEPWKPHYQMESYIADELYALLLAEFPIDANRLGLFGHSMGGHGALTLFQKYPGKWKSVSAFAPVCSPTRSPWGQRVFEHYLGGDKEAWKAHDASELLRSNGAVNAHILIDQGTEDAFMARLHPQVFEAAAKDVGQKLTLRMQEGYDHGYFFIQTFIDDHLRHHLAQFG
jgi:S-formylglutathione hydrolase